MSYSIYYIGGAPDLTKLQGRVDYWCMNKEICATCKFWSFSQDWHPDWSNCNNPNVWDSVSALADQNNTNYKTYKDFGCVRHKSLYATVEEYNEANPDSKPIINVKAVAKMAGL